MVLCCKYIINCLFRKFNYSNINEDEREYSGSELTIINNKLSENSINYTSFSSINRYDLL